MTVPSVLPSSLVLVVDDEPAVRDSLRDLLEDCGYEVETAQDGADALERLESGLRPSLMLLDLMMPRMSGQELIEHLGAHPELESPPVLVVSASVEPVAIRGGAFLSKPFSVEELLGLVARLSSGSAP